MSSTTRMKAFKQLTSTSYNRRNGSIVDVHVPPGAVPVPISINATDYKTVFRTILNPGPIANVRDNSSINALIGAMTWAHRTYVKSFPDDKDSTTSYLRNVLAVPLQHTITAAIFGNYSASERGYTGITQFVLPQEMITTATGGTARSRFAIQWWTGLLFAVGNAVVHLAVLVGLLWVLLRKGSLPGTVGLGDIQVPRDARQTMVIVRKPRWKLPIWGMSNELGLDGMRDGGERGLLDFVEDPEICDETKNVWQLARMLRGVRVKHRIGGVERNAGTTTTLGVPP